MDESIDSAAREAILKAAEGLRGLEHVPAAHADLFERVALAQWEVLRRLTGALYPPIAPGTAAEMLRHGFYLIDFARLKLDAAALDRLCAELCAVLARFGEITPAQAERLQRAVSGGKLSLTELGGAVFRGEQELIAQLARRVRLPQRLLVWLATLTLRPFLAAAARSLEAHLQKLAGREGGSWPHAYCPVCGHDPYMAITLRPEGRRQVECSLCATRWEVRRGRCVFCGNEDKDSYRFFYYDLESPYRVDVCDKCHRYIKGADERKMASDKQVVLQAEDVATLYLDVLARRKRYQPPWTALPGVKARSSKTTEEEVMRA